MGIYRQQSAAKAVAEDLSFFPLRFLWGACRDDRKRLPLQIGYKGIARNTIFVRRQMDDVLIDGAGSERHQIGIRYPGNWWNEIPGLHDHNPKARGIEAQRGEVLNLMEGRRRAVSINKIPLTSTTAWRSGKSEVGNGKMTFAGTSTGWLASGSSVAPTLRVRVAPTPAR